MDFIQNIMKERFWPGSNAPLRSHPTQVCALQYNSFSLTWSSMKSSEPKEKLTSCIRQGVWYTSWSSHGCSVSILPASQWGLCLILNPMLRMVTQQISLGHCWEDLKFLNQREKSTKFSCMFNLTVVERWAAVLSNQNGLLSVWEMFNTHDEASTMENSVKDNKTFSPSLLLRAEEKVKQWRIRESNPRLRAC